MRVRTNRKFVNNEQIPYTTATLDPILEGTIVDIHVKMEPIQYPLP